MNITVNNPKPVPRTYTLELSAGEYALIRYCVGSVAPYTARDAGHTVGVADTYYALKDMEVVQ